MSGGYLSSGLYECQFFSIIYLFRAVRPLDVSELESIAVHGSSPEAKMAVKAAYSPVTKKVGDGEELTFVQPTAKVASTQASADEPVVREKKSAPPTPSTMDSVLAEWAD